MDIKSNAKAMSIALWCFAVPDSLYGSTHVESIWLVRASIQSCNKVSVVLSLTGHAPQHIQIVTVIENVFFLWPHRHGDPTFPTRAPTFCTCSRTQLSYTALCLVFMLILITLPRLKMCNLNPTETSTCRRCQSDSGRATLPSGLQHLFGLWPTHIPGRRGSAHSLHLHLSSV